MAYIECFSKTSTSITVRMNDLNSVSGDRTVYWTCSNGATSSNSISANTSRSGTSEFKNLSPYTSYTFKASIAWAGTTYTFSETFTTNDASPSNVSITQLSDETNSSQIQFRCYATNGYKYVFDLYKGSSVSGTSIQQYTKYNQSSYNGATQTWSGLTSNTQYCCRCIVYSPSSSYSTTKTQTGKTSKATTVPTYTSLTCTSVATTSATFKISASGANRYKFALFDSTNNTKLREYTQVSTDTYTFTGLTANTTYYCRAYPQHYLRDDDYSDATAKGIPFTTLGTPKINSTTITAYPNSLWVVCSCENTTGLTVTVRKNNSSGDILSAWNGASKSNLSFEIGDLPCYNTYYITITPKNSDGSGTSVAKTASTIALLTALTGTAGAKSILGNATVHSDAKLKSSGAFKWELRNSSNTTTLQTRTTDSTKSYQNFGNDCCSENTAYYIRCTAYDKFGGSTIWDTTSTITTKSWFNNLTAYGYPKSLTAVASINATSCWTKCEVYKGASVSGSPVKSVAWAQKTSSTPERTIDGLDYNTVYTCRFYCVDDTANASYASSWDRSFICRPPIFSWTSAETKIFTSRGKISDITVARWNEFVENVALCCEWYWWTDVSKKPDGVDIRAGKIDENSDYKVLTAEKFNCPRGGIGGMKKLVIENDPDNSVPEQEKGNPVLGRYFTKMVSTLASVDHRSWDINSKLTGGK
jgi:hypothetical protein